MIGRDDPCPCGSGEKYKKCCIAKEQVFIEEHNSEVIDDFLGLSSSQMHGVLNSPFGSSYDILSLSDGINVEPKLLSQIPVIKQALYLLNELGKSEKGLKATKAGNLPQSLVQSFYFDFTDEIDELSAKPMSQYDVRELDLLIFALKKTGLIKLKTNWISLTKNGFGMLDKNKYFDLYSRLFNFYGETFDWLSTTYYDDEYKIIQKALSFNLYILKKKAANYINENEISALFQKAFPQTGDVSNPFVTLFLNDFCLYFGLIERDEKRSLLENSKKLKYRQSPFFSDLLDWELEDILR